jgi:serine/threonine protein kinase
VGALGSPPYMSPEQAAGAVESLGPATDIYGLGAILFALLTDEPPVENGPPEEVLDRAQRGAIRRPRSLNPKISRALEAICLKALAPRPQDRYPTARALADDVERWLADEPVTAYRDPLLGRLARWLRRNSHVASVATVFTITALIALSLDDFGYSGINIIEAVLTILAAVLGLLLMLVSLELIRTRRRLVRARSEAAVAGRYGPAARDG